MIVRKFINAGHQIPGIFHSGNLLLQEVFHIPKDIRTPHRLGNVVKIITGKLPAAFFHPFLRVCMALDFLVTCQNKTCDSSVIAAMTKCVKETANIGKCIHFTVDTGKNPLYGPRPQVPTLSLITDAEFSRNIQQICVGTQKAGAKRVNSGDFSQINARQLLSQVQISGILRQSAADFRCNLAPKFRCSRLGICNNQKIINIAGRYRVTNLP